MASSFGITWSFFFVILGLFITVGTLYNVFNASKSNTMEEERISTIMHRRQIRSTERECFWNLTVSEEGGTLTSPNYPNNYPSNTLCRWLLTSINPNDTIFLKIDTLLLEPDNSGCQLDYLQVYLRPNALGPAVGPFCGRLSQHLIQTNSSQVLLEFRSDSSYEERGFSIDYFIKSLGDCQSRVSQNAGIVKSPRFPENYPDSTDCKTLITSDPDKKISLFFDSLDLESEENCPFDYVRVYDGTTENSTLLGQVCNGQVSFESSSNSLLLHFHSDESVNKKGFRARYLSVDKNISPIGDCLWENENDHGYVASPKFPDNYPSLSNCSIWLQAPQGHLISIVFESIQLEIAFNCTYDYLQLKERNYTRTFCGRLLEPKNWTSTTNEVQIVFHSDSFAEFSGFKLKYQFIKNETEIKPERSELILKESLFTNTPQNASLSLHSSYLLECDTHHPNAKIRWLKDGSFLAGESPLQDLKLLANNSLWIQSMDHHLAGVYTCIAVSPEETNSWDAYVSIKDTVDNINTLCNIVFRERPKDSSFLEGDFARLECLVSGDSIHITWEKDGSTMEKKKHITVLKNGFVYFEKVQVNDSGVYTCIAFDEASQCEMKTSAMLQINKKANISEICGKPKVEKPSLDVPQKDHGKIIGGHNAKKGAHPWQVMLWEPTLKSFCGGILLNELWIATAAHCFKSYANLRSERIIIKLGKYDREHQEVHENRTYISDVIIHPSYNSATLDNDLALVRLSNHVKFTNYILPICLGDGNLGKALMTRHSRSSSLPMGTVIGWGKLKEHGPSPRYLQEIRLPIVDQADCIASTNYTVTRNMFCAGYAQEILGDSCNGDSGGPFLMSHNDTWYLIGIVSWGEGCGLANKYGFYTKIPNYLAWIKAIIK